MALKGTGFLALWNDIEAAREPEYNLWHTREHVPERVSVPGILSGRRYAGDATPHRYFTLYELDSLEALESPAYKHLVDNPSPWSRTMRPDFRNFLRHPCATLASVGRGLGAAVTTVRFAVAAGAAPIAATRAQDLCRAMVEANPGLTGAHLGATSGPSAFTIGPAAAADEHPATHVLLLEGHDTPGLLRAVSDVSDAAMKLGAAGPLHVHTYRMLFAVTRADLADAPTPVRRPALPAEDGAR